MADDLTKLQAVLCINNLKLTFFVLLTVEIFWILCENIDFIMPLKFPTVACNIFTFSTCENDSKCEISIPHFNTVRVYCMGNIEWKSDCTHRPRLKEKDESFKLARNSSTRVSLTTHTSAQVIAESPTEISHKIRTRLLCTAAQNKYRYT